MTPTTFGRITSLSTAAALAIGLAACGQNARTADSVPTSTMSTTVSTTAAAPATTTTLTTTTTAAARSSAEFDELVAVGDAKMHLHCAGHGEHTVLLIAGFTSDRTAFGSVEAELSATSRVCSYDRFGTGTSDAPPAPQTFATQAHDLHELLAAAHEGGPYTVVGHSFGGDVAVTFTSLFPADVRGLLLLDASPVTWNAALCDVADDGSATAATFVAGCAMQSAPANNSEGLTGPATFAELAHITSLGAIPMIVDSAAHHGYEGLDPATESQLDEVWNDGQAHWASLSSDAQLVAVGQSGHQIQLDRPDLVIAQVAELNG
ncbi:MAG: alpha/beta hydrolase [Ilumatobacteraceae bacterium]